MIMRNTLAYHGVELITAVKSSIIWRALVKMLYSFFPASLTLLLNKLDCLYLAIFQAGLILEREARTNLLSGASFSAPLG